MNHDRTDAYAAEKQAALERARLIELENDRQRTLAAQDAERLRILALGRAVKVAAPYLTPGRQQLAPAMRMVAPGQRLLPRRERRQLARTDGIAFPRFMSP